MKDTETQLCWIYCFQFVYMFSTLSYIKMGVPPKVGSVQIKNILCNSPLLTLHVVPEIANS